MLSFSKIWGREDETFLLHVAVRTNLKTIETFNTKNYDCLKQFYCIICNEYSDNKNYSLRIILNVFSWVKLCFYVCCHLCLKWVYLNPTRKNMLIHYRISREIIA